MPLETLVLDNFTTSFPRVDFTTEPSASDVYISSLESAEQQIKLQTGSLNEFIAFELSQIREVEYVYTALRNKVFYVWIVIDRFEPQVRKNIYEREKTIIDEFNMFEFDFYIIARMGQDVKDLISGSVKLAYQRS